MTPKIVFVAPSAYLLSGLATWLDYLIPGLCEQEWDARLLLTSGPVHHRPIAYLTEHPGDRVEIAHCETGTPEGRVQSLIQALGRLAPELVVSVNIPDVFPAMNRLRRRGLRSRAIISVHGIEAYPYADCHLYRGIIDAVVCTNRLACELAKSKSGLRAERVLYAPYGVEDVGDGFLVEAPAQELRLIYAGRLETSQKRSCDLVAIVKSLQRRGVNFRLTIVGDGPDRSTIASELAPQIATGSVIMAGRVTSAELKRVYYAESHVLLLTSAWETGPIVAWEAMVQGLVVVSSRYVGSGREDALKDGENALLFEIGDAEGAANAIELIAQEARLWMTLSRAGRRVVRERYSLRESVAAWERAFRTVLEMQPKAAIAEVESGVAGRLDVLLGSRIAEKVRSMLPLSRVRAADPGGEWPHTHTEAQSDASFRAYATQLDAQASVQNTHAA